MSAQKVKTNNRLYQNWCTFLPSLKNLTDENESLCFVDKLCVYALSSILNLRKVLPSESFQEQVIEGTSLFLLNASEENRESRRLTRWLRGMMDAHRRNYLKKMIFSIRKTEDNSILESYTFVFDYISGRKEITMNTEACKIAVTSIVEMMKACQYMADLQKPITEPVCFTMNLVYTKDTPKDYEAPGYGPLNDKQELADFKKSSVHFGCGQVTTPHHLLDLSSISQPENIFSILERSDEESPMVGLNRKNVSPLVERLRLRKLHSQ